jgi:FixJ family two-component response regulator
MRVIIVEGTLDEVLTVLEKMRQSNNIEGVSPVADAAGKHHGEGAGNGEPDKKGCSPLPLLSCRERSIITRLMKGDSNKAIALDLRIAEATVKAHVKKYSSQDRSDEPNASCHVGQNKCRGSSVVAAIE